LANKELMHFIELRRRHLENKIKQGQESKGKNDSTIYGLGQLIMVREIQDLIHSRYRSRPITQRQGLVATSGALFLILVKSLSQEVVLH
jgi:hypothetical protein